MKIYSMDLGFDRLSISADFSQAASQIWLVREGWEDGDGEPTPFQVADAGHSPRAAIRLVLGWLGPGYYQQPGDTRTTSEALDELFAEYGHTIEGWEIER